MKLIYVSGRYRARTWFGKVWNIWKARRVARRLWKEGWAVICPHMNTALFDEDCPYIDGDCLMVEGCDAIFMMRNWEKSEGAKIELATAKIEGIEIIFEGDI